MRLRLRGMGLLCAVAGLAACAPPTDFGTPPAQFRSRLQPQVPRCTDDDDVLTCLQRFGSPPVRRFTARADCSAFTERGDKVIIEPSTRVAHPARFPAGAREGGVVRLRMQVDASGHLRDTRVVESSGNNALEAAAMEAVRDWCYLPAHRDGRDVGGDVDAVFHFNLVSMPRRGGKKLEGVADTARHSEEQAAGARR